MKIMIFTGGFLPAKKYGGPVTSLVNFVNNLGDTYDIDVIASNHDLGSSIPFPDIKPGFNSVGKAQVLYISDRERNIKYFRKIIKDRKPDCLYLSSIFDYKMNLPLLKIAKRGGIKVLYAPRGELADNVMKFGALKKNLFLFAMRLSGLYKNVYFQATSDDEKKQTVLRLNVPENMVFNVPNLPATPIEKQNLIKKPGNLKIVFISRIHRKKNLQFAMHLTRQLKGDVTFDIYGPIEDEAHWKLCENEIAQAPSNIKINYCGPVDPTSVKEVFSKYHCFLFPTFNENYSHAIAESILSGTTPVISLGTTPWDDLNSNGGFALPLEKPDKFVSTLQKLCDMDSEGYQDLYNKLCAYRKVKLNTDNLCKTYQKMFNEVTGK